MGRSSAPILAGVLAAGLTLALGLAQPRADTQPTPSLQDALQDLQDGLFPQAESTAKAVAQQVGEPQPRAWLVVAAARQKQKKYPAAVEAYRAYLASSWSSELRQFVLAQIDACQMADRPAAPTSEPSAGLDEKQIKELSAVEKEDSVESGEHFVVTSRNAKLSKLLARQCESSLTRICRNILAGQEFPHVVEVFVWKDVRDFQAHAHNAPEWAGGSFTVGYVRGRLTRRIDLTQLDRDDQFDRTMIDRVLPHELCHLVTAEFFGDSPCPLFLNEGLAMLAESTVDDERTILAGAALAGKDKLSLDSLVTRTPENLVQASVFYAESFSFTEFLHGRLTDRQFHDFLDLVKGGATIPQAVQRALYVPEREEFLTTLDHTWEDHAAQNAQIARALREPQDQPRK